MRGEIFRGERSNVVRGKIVHATNVNFVRDSRIRTDTQGCMDRIRSLLHCLGGNDEREFLTIMLAIRGKLLEEVVTHRLSMFGVVRPQVNIDIHIVDV